MDFLVATFGVVEVKHDHHDCSRFHSAVSDLHTIFFRGGGGGNGDLLRLSCVHFVFSVVLVRTQ